MVLRVSVLRRQKLIAPSGSFRAPGMGKHSPDRAKKGCGVCEQVCWVSSTLDGSDSDASGEIKQLTKEMMVKSAVPRKIHEQCRKDRRRFLQGGEEHLTHGFQSQDAKKDSGELPKCFFMGVKNA